MKWQFELPQARRGRCTLATLSDHATVYNHCWELLSERGYSLSSELLDPGAEVGSQQLNYFATRQLENGETLTLIADSPPALLGLAIVWDRWGEGWKVADVKNRWSIVNGDE